jgi:3-phytase
MTKFNQQIVFVAALAAMVGTTSCHFQSSQAKANDPSPAVKAIINLKPSIITEQVKYDTDDPAIWINPQDASQSLVVGTDKDSDGGLYVFNLDGKIVNKVTGLQRPNNVDIAYGLDVNGKPTDVAITTEREKNQIKIFSLPDMKPVGNISVFDGEQERLPMGISIYTRPTDHAMFAIVGRKSGPADGYLWQYRLSADASGMVKGELVRKFGKYSGKKEIESIAVDNEAGYIYYSDEQYGVHKYYADPAKGNVELALFGQKDFKEDIEGISIYKHADGTGYILISNQQANTFEVYPREGSNGKPDEHIRIAEIPVSTLESDGSDVTSIHLNDRFPNGMFVAMTNGKAFHFYDWRDIQAVIDAAKNPAN